MVFDSMDPVVTFVAGALPGLVVAGIAWLTCRRRVQRDHADTNLLALYETRPDGVYIWNHGFGNRGTAPDEQASQALREMLHLPDGLLPSFHQVTGTFAPPEAALLNDAVQSLRQAGTGFDMLLPFGERMIHAIGRQARRERTEAATKAAPEITGEIVWFRDVTTLVHNVGIADAEQHLRTVFDAMPIPIWLRDPDLKLAFANERANQTGGAVTDMAAEIASRAMGEGGTQTERRMLDVDGTRRALQITESPLGPGAGTIGFAVEHVENGLDVTSAVQQVLENLDTAIVMYGPDKRIACYNAAFVDLWQMDKGWLDERPGLSQVLDRMRETRLLPEVPDFRAWRAAEKAQFDSLDKPDQRTMHLPDGRTLRTTVVPLPPLSPSPPLSGGGLGYVYEDITHKLGLQRSYKTLDLVQRHTIDNLQESVAVFGGDGRLKLCNAPFLDLWGLAQDTASAEPHMAEIVDYMRDQGEADDVWALRRQQILADFTARQARNGRFRRTDQSIYNVACVPLPDGATLVSYLDITHEAMVEQALRERAHMLEETSRLKSKFIDDVSYEIRTPMTTVSGFSEMLKEGYAGELNARQREYVQGIHATAESMMTVIADILELAAVESGTAQLEKDAIDIHAMLVSAMKLITERARHKEIHMTFDVPTDIGWLSADVKRLKQVIFNLLANAVRFTPRRGGVRVSAVRQENGVTFSISDTGVGIPQADMDRVFQKFSKGEQPAGEPGGAGLGLSMVKSFVELHGGTVSIKSPPNRGTTVTCYLPATGTEGGDARDAFGHDTIHDT